MKPRDKVVTAEDIQSSLYFVHVELPEDAQLLDPPAFREPEYSEQDRTSTTRSMGVAVQRKAVPGTPSNFGGATATRKPVPGTLAPITDLQNRHNISAGNYYQRPGILGPDYSSRRSFDSNQYNQENERLKASPHRASENTQRPGSSLTLIRRDPASGAQWNVARIEDPPVLEVSSSALNESATKRRVGAPMYIEVYNPGYSKFLHSEASSTRDMSDQPSRAATSQAKTTVPREVPPFSESANTFRRRLWMEGSQHVDNGFGHRKNSSYDYSNAARPDSRGSYVGQADIPSTGLRSQPPPSFLTHSDQTYSTIQTSDRQTSFRGYVFNSPWNGRCEFITGAGGGSLKVHRCLLPRPWQRLLTLSVVPTQRSRASRGTPDCSDRQ